MTLSDRQLLLAGVAFGRALAGDYDAAHRHVQALADDDPAVIPAVLAAWIDTVLLKCGISEPPATAAWPGWALRTASGVQLVRDADLVPPADRWAGRLFTARYNLDFETFQALINSVPDDTIWAANVDAVLRTAAGTYRAALAGEPVLFPPDAADG